VFGGQRVAQLVAGEGEHVEPEQHGRARRVRPAGQEDGLLAAPPRPGEEHQPERRDHRQHERRRAGEQHPATGPVQERDQRVDVGHHHPPAAHHRQQAAPEAQRPGPSGDRFQRAERVDGQLGEHAVAGQVGDDAGDLVGRQATADPGEVGDQAGHRTGAVHQLRELPLLRRKPQVAGPAAVIRRAEHHVRHVAHVDQLDGLDAQPQHRLRPRRIEPLDHRGPQPWISRTRRPTRCPARERLPHTQPGLNDRHPLPLPQLAGCRVGRRHRSAAQPVRYLTTPVQPYLAKAAG
jgi:hypothetical protein